MSCGTISEMFREEGESCVILLMYTSSNLNVAFKRKERGRYRRRESREGHPDLVNASSETTATETTAQGPHEVERHY